MVVVRSILERAAGDSRERRLMVMLLYCQGWWYNTFLVPRRKDASNYSSGSSITVVERENLIIVVKMETRSEVEWWVESYTRKVRRMIRLARAGISQRGIEIFVSTGKIDTAKD